MVSSQDNERSFGIVSRWFDQFEFFKAKIQATVERRHFYLNRKNENDFFKVGGKKDLK